MFALPLKLEGCQIIDANGVSIAIVRGEMAEYRAWGAEIVAAVNGFAKLPDLLEGSVREAIKYPLASLDKFEEHYTRLRESHAGLLAAAKEMTRIIEIAGRVERDSHAMDELQSAIAKAEKA